MNFSDIKDIVETILCFLLIIIGVISLVMPHYETIYLMSGAICIITACYLRFLSY